MQRNFNNQEVENKSVEHWDYIERLLRIHDENIHARRIRAKLNC